MMMRMMRMMIMMRMMRMMIMMRMMMRMMRTRMRIVMKLHQFLSRLRFWRKLFSGQIITKLIMRRLKRLLGISNILIWKSKRSLKSLLLLTI